MEDPPAYKEIDYLQQQALPPISQLEHTPRLQQHLLGMGADALPHRWPHTVGELSGDSSHVDHVGLKHIFNRSGTCETTQARVHIDPKKRTRAFRNRSKKACITCRRRKKKCDETRPSCKTCRRGDFVCDGYMNNASMPKELLVTRNPQPEAKDERLSLETGHQDSRPTVSRETHQEFDKLCPSIEFMDGQPAVDGGYEFRLPPLKNDWHREEHHRVSAPLTHTRTHTTPVAHHATLPQDDSHAQKYQQPQQRGSRSLRPHNFPICTHASRAEDQIYNDPTITPSEVPILQPNPSLYHARLTQPIGPLELRPADFTLPPSPKRERSEKDKMISHKPFMPYDSALVEERYSCKEKLLKFNSEERGHHRLTPVEGQPMFRAVVGGKMLIHPWLVSEDYAAPGHVGQNVHVNIPFHCDYGYHLVIGDMVTIGRNCAFLDSGKITIGRNTRICANVTIDTQRIPTDPISDKGSGGCVVAAEVTIGENCYIGANVTIIGPAEIRMGAIIRPGSVITGDVGCNNPALPLNTNAVPTWGDY